MFFCFVFDSQKSQGIVYKVLYSTIVVYCNRKSNGTLINLDFVYVSL